MAMMTVMTNKPTTIMFVWLCDGGMINISYMDGNYKGFFSSCFTVYLSCSGICSTNIQTLPGSAGQPSWAGHWWISGTAVISQSYSTFCAGTCFQNKKPVGLRCDRLVICALLVGHMLGMVARILIVCWDISIGILAFSHIPLLSIDPTWLGNIPSTMAFGWYLQYWFVATGIWWFQTVKQLTFWRCRPWNQYPTELSRQLNGEVSQLQLGVHNIGYILVVQWLPISPFLIHNVLYVMYWLVSLIKCMVDLPIYIYFRG